MHIALIVGARPNFMKIAPILRAIKAYPSLTPVLIHTGQHYDKYLSDVFFDELGIDPPDIALGIGSGTHAQQTADIMVAIERILLEFEEKGQGFKRMVVVGDVNSTMAATIAAAKLLIPVAHVEAGLRSFDRTMPEEINRMLTDSVCDMLLPSEPDGVTNLKNEGHDDSKIHLVGNVMIDTLLNQVERAKQSKILSELSLQSGNYGVVTLHRPANVDNQEVLEELLSVLTEISAKLPLVFPIHPRTKSRLESFGLFEELNASKNIACLGPLGYNDFLCLTSQAKVIVTDSGGLQEESTALDVPCLTMRPNTERPITVTQGTSTLVGSDATKLKKHLTEVIDGTYKKGSCPELWDGKAAERIAAILAAEATS
ncbi:MAG: UDP-N-acetylglucosamine 2-epimerase (non-hydrolyzing) [Mariniblastus sp.]|jgi:UDP-N-acetylglucosamine 2-epimerase (non-hydrolysing)